MPAGTSHGGRVAIRKSETAATLAGQEPESLGSAVAGHRGTGCATSLPDGAVLHPRIAFDRNRDGGYETVWCMCIRCGEFVEDYDLQAAIDAGADRCDERDPY